jgi:hypothetical protein
MALPFDQPIHEYAWHLRGEHEPDIFRDWHNKGNPFKGFRTLPKGREGFLHLQSVRFFGELAKKPIYEHEHGEKRKDKPKKPA